MIRKKERINHVKNIPSIKCVPPKMKLIYGSQKSSWIRSHGVGVVE